MDTVQREPTHIAKEIEQWISDATCEFDTAVTLTFRIDPETVEQEWCRPIVGLRQSSSTAKPRRRVLVPAQIPGALSSPPDPMCRPPCLEHNI